MVFRAGGLTGKASDQTRTPPRFPGHSASLDWPGPNTPQHFDVAGGGVQASVGTDAIGDATPLSPEFTTAWMFPECEQTRMTAVKGVPNAIPLDMSRLFIDYARSPG